MAVFAEGFRQHHPGFAGGEIGQHPGPVQGHPGRTRDQQGFHREPRITANGWHGNIRLAERGRTPETHRVP